MRSKTLYKLLVIMVIIMASLVVILRDKGQQSTVSDVSNLNGLESAYYVKLNSTIWQDSLNDSSPWHVTYSQPNMTAQMTARGTLNLNANFSEEPYSQAVNIYRSVNFSLSQNPVLRISLDVSRGIHYGIRMTGRDASGLPFRAWSESSYLQHRDGLGRRENFTMNAEVEAYKVNGNFPSAGSTVNSLAFYLEATPSQTGNFSLSIYGISADESNQYQLNASKRVFDEMDAICLVVNSTNQLGYGDAQFAQGYVDYYLTGTNGLHYTVYYLHGLTVVGQGYFYSASSLTYNLATFSASNVVSYPPLFVSNNTYSIILSSTQGSFLSFQLGGFSIRYLSQAPFSGTSSVIDHNIILAYYLIFLFATPIAISILVSRTFSHETSKAS